MVKEEAHIGKPPVEYTLAPEKDLAASKMSRGAHVENPDTGSSAESLVE
jgi:hypothetical protein